MVNLMGKHLCSLEECLESLQRCAKEEHLGVGAELIGIHHLRQKDDIVAFLSAYKDLLKEFYSALQEKKRKGKFVRALVDTGYSMDDIAEFYLQDGFYFTLGHIFTRRALDAWYPALAERWTDEDRQRFSEMYLVIRE